MLHLSAMALFCEDIREEVGATVTLVGILPDNINVGNIASAPTEGAEKAASINKRLSKLCIYARLHFDPEQDVGEPSIRLSGLRDEPIELGKADADVIKKTQADAKEKGNLFSGVVFRLALEGFRFPDKSGTMVVEIIVQGKAYPAGGLTFHVPEKEAATSSSVH